MQLYDLQIGVKVQIIDFGGDEPERPEHWSPDGDMDEWQGAVVTIAEIVHSEECVYIEEDEGTWSWYAWDFEPYCNLDFNDPNLSYKRHKSKRFIREARKELKAKQA